MRPPGTTQILLALACAVCAAAIAALPGPGASANPNADAADIVSALSLAPKAVTAWERARGERHKACAPPETLPGLGFKLTKTPACPARRTVRPATGHSSRLTPSPARSLSPHLGVTMTSSG